MKDLSEDLKQTEELSTDAERVAHDALASIDARHQVIKDSIVTGRTLLDDNTAIKMAMEATEKALVDAEDDDDVGGRLEVLKEKMGRIGNITQSLAKMMTQFKSRLANVRE